MRIISSEVLSSVNSENAIVKNNASFCFNVITVSPFDFITVSVINRALGEVYRKAVQYLL